jgi:hypothetical protein
VRSEFKVLFYLLLVNFSASVNAQGHYEDDFFGPAPQWIPDSSEPVVIYTEPPHEMTAIEAAEELYNARFFINRVAGWCIANYPSSSNSITKAKDSWLSDNSKLLIDADSVINTLSEGKLRILALTSRIDAENGESRLSNKPKDLKYKWCMNVVPTTIRSEKLKLSARQDIQSALAKKEN